MFFTGFDGMSYAVYPGKECSAGDPCYLKVVVSFDGGAKEAKVDDQDSKDKAKASDSPKDRKALTDEARELNQKLAPWVFVIPKWQHEAFMTQLSELLEKETEKKTEP